MAEDSVNVSCLMEHPSMQIFRGDDGRAAHLGKLAVHTTSYEDRAIFFFCQHSNPMMVIGVLGVCCTLSFPTCAQAPPAQPAPTSRTTRGEDLYVAQCSACHQADGEGVPGVFPPLKASGVVNKDDGAKHMRVVLYGTQGDRAGGVVYAAAMPPFAGVLSDADIADIIDYERRSWGNHGKPVTAAQVAAERSRPQ